MENEKLIAIDEVNEKKCLLIEKIEQLDNAKFIIALIGITKEMLKKEKSAHR